MHGLVGLKPGVNELGEPVQLRPPDRLVPPIARRHREGQHLINCPARNVEMLRCCTPAHVLGTRQANLLVKFHGIDLPTLPAAARREKWQVFTPPAARRSRRYRGLILHRRFQSHGGKNACIFWIILLRQSETTAPWARISCGMAGQDVLSPMP
jgi:hypothetical protein